MILGQICAYHVTSKYQKILHLMFLIHSPNKKKTTFYMSVDCFPCCQKQKCVYKGIQISQCFSPLYLANQIALLSAKKLGGEPFGAVIVQYNSKKRPIHQWTAHANIAQTNDPTAHAEVNCIRKACKSLQQSSLQDCVLFASSEPCPLCFSAIYWAKIPIVIFSSTRNDQCLHGVGFCTKQLYREVCLPYKRRKSVRVYHALCSNSLEAFNYWKQKNRKFYKKY